MFQNNIFGQILARNFDKSILGATLIDCSFLIHGCRELWLGFFDSSASGQNANGNAEKKYKKTF
jgi:hypothetical protein